MTGRKRSIAHPRAIAGMIAVAGAILPVSAVAQTAADVGDQIRKLQDAIGTIQKEHQSEITTIQKQYQAEIRNLQKQHQAQIQNLQKQLDDLKAAQGAPRAAPPPPSAAAVAQAAAPGPVAAPPSTPAAAQPPSAAVQPPAAVGQGGPVVMVGTPPPLGLPLPSAGVHVLETGSGRFGIESADGRNAIFLTGRLHLDAGDYLDYQPGSRFAAVQDLNSGVNARRARIGVVARYASDWDFNLIYDLGGSGDGFPPDPGAGASGLENALVTYSGLKNHGVPLVFDLGIMDVPFTQAEGGVSSNDIPLVERAAIVNVVAPIMANDFRSAFGPRSFTDRYWAGAYVTGPTTGSNHTTGEPLGAVGRAGYNPWSSPEGFFHLEADLGALLKPPAPGGIRTITLSERPELRVDPTSILSTGALGTAANPLNNVWVYGGGGIVEWRNFLVDGEAYQIKVNRQGLATNSFEGGYIQGSWILTGEQRKYSPPSGGYLRPVPEHPFMPFDGSCCGAFELAARYSTVDLNDNFTPRPPPGSNSVGGGQQTVYAVGLNWYPNANMRFMFDYLHGKINKRFSTAAGGGIAGTPPGTPVGGAVDAVVGRMQVAF